MQRDVQATEVLSVDVPRVGVLVPVKAFSDAKQRLRGALDDAQRVAVSRWCAERVVASAREWPVYVACDNSDVAGWAVDLGASVVHCPEVGLNAAVERGVDTLAADGFDLAVIVHGDLPLAKTLADLVLPDAVTVVPDYRYDGTNALVLPTALAGQFAFHYGRGSFRRHVIEAIERCPTVRIFRDTDLAHDLDTPNDLADPRMEEVRQWLQTNPVNLP